MVMNDSVRNCSEIQWNGTLLLKHSGRGGGNGHAMILFAKDPEIQCIGPLLPRHLMIHFGIATQAFERGMVKQ